MFFSQSRLLKCSDLRLNTRVFFQWNHSLFQKFSFQKLLKRCQNWPWRTSALSPISTTTFSCCQMQFRSWPKQVQFPRRFRIRSRTPFGYWMNRESGNLLIKGTGNTPCISQMGMFGSLWISHDWTSSLYLCITKSLFLQEFFSQFVAPLSFRWSI